MHGVTLFGLAKGALWFSLFAHGHHGGQSFSLIEESERLPEDTSQEGTSSTDVDLVDLDGDGDLDMFISEGTASQAGRANRLYLNDGSGVFGDESAVLLAGAANTSNTAKSAFGDVDRDGDLDALLANLGQEQLLLNDGTGMLTLAAPGQLPLTFGPDVSADAALVDVDADGDLDALISNENPFAPGPLQGAQNRLYLNDGNGFFRELPLPAATDQSVGMLTGDIDADGDLDIVVLNRGQERVLVGDGTGSFVEETATRIPLLDLTVPNVSSARGGALSDLDADGDLDLVIGNSRGQAVEYYKNDGSGVFVPASFGHVPNPDETISAFALVDLDDDGDLDVYLGNAGRFEGGPGGHGFFGGTDRYFRNNGRGQFQERTSKHFNSPSDPTTSAAFGDLDGDGDQDLVVGNTDDNVPGDTGSERIFMHRHRCLGGFWW